MKDGNLVYVVIYEVIPMASMERGRSSTIVGHYHEPENAVDLVKYYADLVTADYGDDRETTIKVIYNGPAHNWPWLFTWEEDAYQLTYKVVPYEYKD